MIDLFVTLLCGLGGFDDLARGTASEAIAYFLVERSRLSETLQTERRKSLTDKSSKDKSELVSIYM